MKKLRGAVLLLFSCKIQFCQVSKGRRNFELSTFCFLKVKGNGSNSISLWLFRQNWAKSKSFWKLSVSFRIINPIFLYLQSVTNFWTTVCDTSLFWISDLIYLSFDFFCNIFKFKSIIFAKFFSFKNKKKSGKNGEFTEKMDNGKWNNPAKW